MMFLLLPSSQPHTIIILDGKENKINFVSNIEANLERVVRSKKLEVRSKNTDFEILISACLIL